jgi:hypothetical protein
MFRRTQASLLSVMAGTFFAAVTLLPNPAKAAGDCLANPTGAAPGGRHWHYHLNRVTRQKCWFLGVKRSTVRSVALRRSSDRADHERFAERTTATSCIAAPGAHAPRGKRWSYQVDQATGQRCWRLGDRASRIGKAVRSQISAPARLTPADRLPSQLPPSIADAQASIQDTVNEAAARNEIALSEADVAKEVTYEDLLRSTFGSRWADPVDTARPSSFQSGPSGEPAIYRRSLVVAGLDARPFETADRLVANGSSPGDALAAFLVSAGSVLVLLGLCGRLFLSQRDQSPALEYPAPLRLPSFEGASENPVHANMQGSLDASAERDRYGIPSAALQARRSVAGGAGSGHAATPLFTPPNKKRASTLTNAARESQRLAESAVE